MRPVVVKPSKLERTNFRLWTHYAWLWKYAVGPFGEQQFKRRGEEALHRSMLSIIEHATCPLWKWLLLRRL